MIEPLDDMPAGTLGFRAVGTVEPDDYKTVLTPAVESTIAEHHKVNLVYVIGDDFDRYSLGAMWQDTLLGFHKPSVWGRIAFVTNHDWLAHAGAIFAPITPGELKVFPLERQDEAVAWVAGS